MSALFSFRNEVISTALARGTTVSSGALANLDTRQLARGVVLQGGDADGQWLDLMVRKPMWGAHTPPTPDQSEVSRAGVRVVALLGLNLPAFDNTPYAGYREPRIKVYGRYYDSSGTPYTTLLGDMPATRDVATEGEAGLVNRILSLPALSGMGRSYFAYRVNIALSQNSNYVLPYIGRAWVGNAIEFDNGVDASWVRGTQDSGDVAVSRGGQAYARPGSLLRTLRASIGGPGLDARLAFGKGVTVPNTGIRRESDWLSDAATHLGTTGSCLLVPRGDASGSFWTQTTALYGRLTSPIEIEHVAGDYYRSQFSMIEER